MSFSIRQTNRTIYSATRSRLICRNFNTSRLVLKKKPANEEEQDQSDDFLAKNKSILDKVDPKFSKVISDFTAKAKLLKTGQPDADKWRNIQIETASSGDIPLKALANIQFKGGNRIIEIVAFNPKDLKYIQSSIISKLNITPQADAKNNQTLTVQIPPRKKDESLRQLKELYEASRVSRRVPSLADARSQLLTDIKKIKSDISENDFRQSTSIIEAAHKSYSKKLQDEHKLASSQVTG